jgi:hypothetical protein
LKDRDKGAGLLPPEVERTEVGEYAWFVGVNVDDVDEPDAFDARKSDEDDVDADEEGSAGGV